MKNQWYCENCGIIEDFRCECGTGKLKAVPPFVLAMQERIAELEAAHKANLHQQAYSVKYEDKGHRCSWRVAYEAAMQRSKAALEGVMKE